MSDAPRVREWDLTVRRRAALFYADVHGCMPFAADLMALVDNAPKSVVDPGGDEVAGDIAWKATMEPLHGPVLLAILWGYVFPVGFLP